MSVPAFVPEKVPARRKTAAKPRYLTGDPTGWRFQMRLPTEIVARGLDLQARPHGQGSLGPVQPRRGQASGAATRIALPEHFQRGPGSKDGACDDNERTQKRLAKQVIRVHQTAIDRALAQPSQAIGLAQGLGSALQTLQLVQFEIAKGQSGAAAIVANAEMLARGALTDVLTLSAQPNEALAALAAVSHAYIVMRIERDGEDHADIQTLKLRRQTFLDVIGDKRVDEYVPSDLQNYVNRMQSWPANVTKRVGLESKTTTDILEKNKKLTLRPMAAKTMMDGFVANVRTMRHGMADHRYQDPFANYLVKLPKNLRASRPREPLGPDCSIRSSATALRLVSLPSDVATSRSFDIPPDRPADPPLRR